MDLIWHFLKRKTALFTFQRPKFAHFVNEICQSADAFGFLLPIRGVTLVYEIESKFWHLSIFFSR